MATFLSCVLALVIYIQVMYIPGTYAYNCSTNCMPSSSSSSEVCDEMTGRCLYGCKPGYVGEQCSLPCCHGCQQCHLVNESSAEVVCNECSEGFYMRQGECSKCNKNCLQGCNEDTGRCNHGCKPGFYGSTCSQTCHEMCMDRKCDSKTGWCVDGCSNTVLTGHNCSNVCSKGCKDRECSQTGECMSKGCNPGYWGSGCRTLCNTECAVPSDSTLSACDDVTGVCLHGCNGTSHWGTHCTDRCETKCDLPSYQSQRVCEEHTGLCLHGCNNVGNTWGPACTYPCHEKCRTSDFGQKTCSEDNGECLHGCIDNKYWGPSCDRLCLESCADSVCQSGTGACLRGCIEGYEGEKCDMKDFCFLTKAKAIIIIIIPFGLSFILNLVLCGCVCHYRRKSRDGDFKFPRKSQDL